MTLVETILTQAEKGSGAPLLRFIDDQGREESFDYPRLRDEALRSAGVLARVGANVFPDAMREHVALPAARGATSMVRDPART